MGMSFPLAFVPSASYKSPNLGFKAKRPVMGPRRLHGACDLLAPVGTTVFAIDDGIVIKGPYYFYASVYAIEVRHRFFTIRYGELEHKTLVKTGDPVTRGKPIGHIGQCGTGSMLHLEMYSGKETGPLNDHNSLPFMRRKDLTDPAPFLDLWSCNLPQAETRILDLGDYTVLQ